MQSILRLRIAEHFDSLRNQVDLFTETKISKNVDQESFWNKRRQDQMDEMEQMETAGLVKASRVRDESIDGEESEMMMSKLLDGVCFLLEYGCMQFLVKVDRHVDQSEIEYLREFVKLEKKGYKEMLEFLTNGQRKYYDKIVLGEAFIKFEELLAVDSAVVNMNCWFDQEYHIDLVAFELSALQKFDCLLRIHTLVVFIDLSRVEDIVKTIQIVQESFKQAKSIVLRLYQSGLPAISSLYSIKWDQRTTPVINIRSYNQLQLLQSSMKLDLYHKNFEVYPHSTNWFSKVNWSQIYELTFDSCKADDLNQVDLSSLRSLRKCIFTDCMLDQVDWSFLDSIRACIKYLEFDHYNQLSRVSWKMFSGMTSLKSIKFDQEKYTEVDLDAQGQLFADLIQLKTLNLNINQCLLETEWLCELPRLEELSIRIVDNPDISIRPVRLANLRFKLPKLLRFDLLYCSGSSKLDLAPALSNLSHVQKLKTISYYLSRGWFRGFKCFTLELSRNDSMVDSSLFVGLDNLRSINLSIQGDELKDDALGALVNLESIRLTVNEKTWLERNMHKFNGLRSLKSIFINSYPYNHSSESLVYFENLDKFILVRNNWISCP